MNVYAKFRCAPLPSKQVLGIFGPLETTPTYSWPCMYVYSIIQCHACQLTYSCRRSIHGEYWRSWQAVPDQSWWHLPLLQKPLNGLQSSPAGQWHVLLQLTAGPNVPGGQPPAQRDHHHLFTARCTIHIRACIARYCHIGCCSSVCDAEVSWSCKLGYFGTNDTAN